MKVIFRKLLTAKKILREGNFSHFLRFLKLKITRPSQNSYFKQINKFVIEDLANSHLKISREISQAVSYTYEVGVKGDIAEFGTMTGFSAIAIATAANIKEFEFRNYQWGSKKLYFFDSFEGLPEAKSEIDKNAPYVQNGIWGKGTCKGLSKEEFQKLIERYFDKNNFFVHKGWFSDTVPSLDEDVCFSFVHIDGDLYESAIDVLDSLFKRKKISNGAIILFDDWNCNAANPDLGERKAFREIVEKYKVDYFDEGSYSGTSHKFIINSYE